MSNNGALSVVSLFYLMEPLFDQVGDNAIWAVMTVVVVFEFTAGMFFVVFWEFDKYILIGVINYLYVSFICKIDIEHQYIGRSFNLDGKN